MYGNWLITPIATMWQVAALFRRVKPVLEAQDLRSSAAKQQVTFG